VRRATAARTTHSRESPLILRASHDVTIQQFERLLTDSGAVRTDMLRFLARVVVTPADARIILEELSGVSQGPMILRMPTTSRPQQRYDHRLRDLVQRTGELTIATDLGVPRSTARGWLGAAPTVVVSLEGADLTAPELRQEIVKLRRRVEKLAALLRLALAPITHRRVSGS
jgi:hypothetical protein